MNKITRILSIDGGGIRGLIPAHVLLTLENIIKEKTGNKNARIADYFDMIAGTSTGGILTCIYLCPDKKNPSRPRFSADKAVKFYSEDGGRIFKSSIWRKIISLGGLINVKYSEASLEKLLKEYFGDLLLSELIKPCLITAYDIKGGNASFFTQHTAEYKTEANFYVKDVARSTSAAPTFFKPKKIKSLAHKSFTMVDGGVFANNPTLCAYAEACKSDHCPSIGEMAILSLGVGKVSESYKYRKVKDWGGIQWAGPIIGIMMSGVSETVDYQLKKLYDSVNKKSQYLRIDPVLDQSDPHMIDMDNASPENIKEINDIGAFTAKMNYDKLYKFADLIINQGANKETDSELEYSEKLEA